MGRVFVKKCPRCHIEDVLEGYDGECWSCVHASKESEAALTAAVVEAAEHCTAEGCTFSAWEARYRAVKDACAALQAFREGRAK